MKSLKSYTGVIARLREIYRSGKQLLSCNYDTPVVYYQHMLTPDDIQQLKEILATKDDIRALKQDIAKLDKKLDSAEEDIAEILKAVLEHHGDLEQRITKLEEHIGITHS